VSRGDIDNCSFSFEVGRDSWDEGEENGARFVRRTIHSFKQLADVSVVTYPAYDDTSVGARAIVPEAVFAEARNIRGRARRTASIEGFRARMTARLNRSLSRALAQDTEARRLAKAKEPVAPVTDEQRRAHAARVGESIKHEKVAAWLMPEGKKK